MNKNSDAPENTEDLMPQVIAKNSLNLAQQTSIDISQLPQEQQNELVRAHAMGHIEIQRKAAELGIDAKSLETRLKTMGTQTQEAVDSGAVITITNTKEDTMGRTEVIMGNSDTAQKGRLTRSQQGKRGSFLGWLFGR
jgi:hypothetical protein